MHRCDRCGGTIEFRRQGGSTVPIHLSGGCNQNSYSSSGLGGFRNLSPYSSSLTQSSYVNPNARCPVCHERVFFYKSSDGGRVFFDALGPPWPKHPCTDNYTSFKEREVLSEEPPPEIQYKWQEEGWSPFFCSKIEQNDGGMSRITGVPENSTENWTLYILGSLNKLIGECYSNPPMLFKVIDQEKGKYQIATFKFGINRQVQEVYFEAYRKKRE